MEVNEKRIELHKKLRNLSPIQRSGKNEENLQKLTKKSPKPKEIKKIPEKKPPSIVSKNINEYRHIINTRKPDDTELKWVLQLRAYKDQGRYRKLEEFKNNMHINVYDRDIVDYMSKIKQSKRAELKTAQPNLNAYRHLYQTRIDGSANASQFGFESSLRNFYKKDSSSKEKWRDSSELQKPRLFSSYYTSANILSPVNDKLGGPHCILKAYESVYDKVTVDHKEVRRKRLKESENIYQEFLGENAGAKYSSKFRVANVNDGRHLISAHTNSLSRFELGLRNYNDKNADDEVKKNENIQKSK